MHAVLGVAPIKKGSRKLVRVGMHPSPKCLEFHGNKGCGGREIKDGFDRQDALKAVIAVRTFALILDIARMNKIGVHNMLSRKIGRTPICSKCYQARSTLAKIVLYENGSPQAKPLGEMVEVELCGECVRWAVWRAYWKELAPVR